MRELALLPLATLRSKRDADMHLSRQVLDPQIRQFALMNLAEERQASGVSRLSWRINLDAIVRQLPTIAGAEVTERVGAFFAAQLRHASVRLSAAYFPR